MCSTPGRRVPQQKRRPADTLANYGNYANMVRRSNAAYELRQTEKRQLMLESEHPHVKEVVIERVACPLHIIQLKNALKELQTAETLQIKAGNYAVVTDLVAASKALGHATKVVLAEARAFLYVTKGVAICEQA